MSTTTKFVPRVHAVATAFPPHVVDAEATVRGLRELFPAEDEGFIRTLVERSGVDRRRMALPPEDIVRPRPFTVRQEEYRVVAERIALEASERALARAGVRATEIDVIIDVSCTGVLIPALDVRLSPALGLRPDVRRYPITEAGCAAGSLALGLAQKLARLGERVLVVAVELCSLSLVRDDSARANLVAGVLFGDGAAAAVVGPGEAGPAITGVGSHLFPGTESIMGFDVGTHGLKLVLKRELPGILEKGLKPVIDGFLARHEVTIKDIDVHILHTGGRRVLDTYRAMFDLREDDLAFSSDALRRYGNLSSAAVLSVLEPALHEKAAIGPGKRALICAFGPGLSAEMVLLRGGE